MTGSASVVLKPSRSGVRWVADADPPERRPVGHGWSMGRIKLTVAGENLTESALQGERQPYVGWYLSPVLDWLATPLGGSASRGALRLARTDQIAGRRGLSSCTRPLDRCRRSDRQRGLSALPIAWYHRHGLRSAALGGIFPDLFIRRSGDDIELSWTSDPPQFAPEGLTFESKAGHVRLAVAEFAEPLWELLQWATTEPSEMPAAYRDDWADLCRKVEGSRRTRCCRIRARVRSGERCSMQP